MNVYLWNFTKKKKSTKIPATTPTPVDIKLKDIVDIEHPSFTLTKATLGNNNYMKTTFFDGKERYYFLTDVEDGFFGQVIAHFEEDYLATWGAGQENAESVFASRCGSVLMERYFGQNRLKDVYREFTGKMDVIKHILSKDYLSLNGRDSITTRLFLIGLHTSEGGLYKALTDSRDYSMYDEDLRLNYYSTLDGSNHIFKPINAFAVRGNVAYYLVYGTELIEFANHMLELAVKLNLASSKWESFLETVIIDVIATPFTTDIDGDNDIIVGSSLTGSYPIKVYQRDVCLYIKNGVSIIPGYSEAYFYLNVLARVPDVTEDRPKWKNSDYMEYLVNNNGTDYDLCYSELLIPMDNNEIINSGRDGTSYREYTTTAPYSTYTLHIPMWGDLEIPMDRVHDAVPTDDDYNNYVNPSYEKRLLFRWCMDWIGGNAFIGLYNSDDNSFICGDIKTICYRMPIQVQYDDTGMAQSVFKLTTAALSLITPIAGLATSTTINASTPKVDAMVPPQGASKETVNRYRQWNTDNKEAIKATKDAQEAVDNEFHNVANNAANIPIALSGFLNASSGNSGALVSQSDLDIDIEDDMYILINRAEILPIFYDVYGVPVEKTITFYDVGQPSKAGFWSYKNYHPKKYGTMHERDMLKAICESGFWVE